MDFLIEFFKLAKAQGIHTTIDTAGNPFTREEPFFSKFNEPMALTDLFLLDIKQIEDDKHRELTGFSNKNILTWHSISPIRESICDSTCPCAGHNNRRSRSEEDG